MARPKFDKFKTPVGIAKYPALTEPDTKFDEAGVYKTGLLLPGDAPETQAFISKLEGIRDAFAEQARAEDAKRKRYSLADVCEDELDEEGEPTGNVVFKIKRKAKVTKKNGDIIEMKPNLWDAHNVAIKDVSSLRLWTGSEIACAGDVVPYAMANGKTIGVSLRLQHVQVISLSAAGGSPFDDHDDGYTAEDEAPENPFGDPSDTGTADSASDDGDY